MGGLVFPEIRRWGTEPDRTWTVDMWLTPTETLPELILEQWRGAGDDLQNPNLRKLMLVTGGGAYRTLMSNINGSFATALRCKRPGGANIATAGVPVLISIQNNGAATQVFVDGVLCGTTYVLGLEFSHFARAVNDPNEAFLGKVDELRVTFAARYTGNFTPPTAPYPTLAAPTGQFVVPGGGGFTGLPTTSVYDAVYLVELTLSGGGYVAANPADEYLRALPGAQVTGTAGAQYWGVLVQGYRAAGLAATTANIEAAIAAVVDPAAPPALLLTAPGSRCTGAAAAGGLQRRRAAAADAGAEHQHRPGDAGGPTGDGARQWRRGDDQGNAAQERQRGAGSVFRGARRQAARGAAEQRQHDLWRHSIVGGDARGGNPRLRGDLHHRLGRGIGPRAR